MGISMVELLDEKKAAIVLNSFEDIRDLFFFIAFFSVGGPVVGCYAPNGVVMG